MILVEHRDVIVHNVLGMSELREVVQNAVYPPDLLGSKRFVEEPSSEDLSGVVLLLHELEHPAVELGGKAARELPADIFELVLIVERKADKPALRFFLPGELRGFGIYPVYIAGIYQLALFFPRRFLPLSRNFALDCKTNGLRGDARSFGSLRDIHRPLKRVMYRREEYYGLLEVRRAVLLLVEVETCGLLAKLVVYCAAGGFDKVGERLRAEFLDVFVGVLSAGHLKHPRLDSRLAEQVDAAGSGFLP